MKMGSDNTRIKLVFPPKFFYPDLIIASHFNHLPYGMGVLSAFLRQNGFKVEQEDLLQGFVACQDKLFVI